MKLNKEEVQKLFVELLNLVDSKPAEFFNLRKMHGTVGLCYMSDIELDYRRDIIPTTMHELLHYLYPMWNETSVLYAESRLINTCSTLQVATFLKKIADKIYESETNKEHLKIKLLDTKTNSNMGDLSV